MTKAPDIGMVNVKLTEPAQEKFGCPALTFTALRIAHLHLRPGRFAAPVLLTPWTCLSATSGGVSSS